MIQIPRKEIFKTPFFGLKSAGVLWVGPGRVHQFRDIFCSVLMRCEQRLGFQRFCPCKWYLVCKMDGQKVPNDLCVCVIVCVCESLGD